MSKINVGVVGVGHLGRIHAKLYNDIPDARLSGVYDIDKERARQIADETGCAMFESFDALLEAVDAVNIVTPTTTHFELALKAIEHNRHVFIEKPIATREEEALRLIGAGNARGLCIQVGHIERFNPAVTALQGFDLQPVFIEAHRLAQFNPRGTDVAVILDLMIHDLDLILHLVKSEPVHVAASGVNVVSHNADIANARIEFENGCVANVTASRISAKKMRKMRIFQQSAYLSLDFNAGKADAFYLPDAPGASGDMDFLKDLGQLDAADVKRVIRYKQLTREGVNPLKDELQAFLDAVQGKRSVPVPADEGLKALGLARRVLKEIEHHHQKWYAAHPVNL
ncbi:MAG: gfo/Idh/MocA family oxidoreductase [Calditrichaeota bacterium]|nr:MAG: gfo/Idh/MocA family oxidoreductase [Calditrichota bacterium]